MSGQPVARASPPRGESPRVRNDERGIKGRLTRVKTCVRWVRLNAFATARRGCQAQRGLPRRLGLGLGHDTPAQHLRQNENAPITQRLEAVFRIIQDRRFRQCRQCGNLGQGQILDRLTEKGPRSPARAIAPPAHVNRCGIELHSITAQFLLKTRSQNRLLILATTSNGQHQMCQLIDKGGCEAKPTLGPRSIRRHHRVHHKLGERFNHDLIVERPDCGPVWKIDRFLRRPLPCAQQDCQDCGKPPHIPTRGRTGGRSRKDPGTCQLSRKSSSTTR